MSTETPPCRCIMVGSIWVRCLPYRGGFVAATEGEVDAWFAFLKRVSEQEAAAIAAVEEHREGKK